MIFFLNHYLFEKNKTTWYHVENIDT